MGHDPMCEFRNHPDMSRCYRCDDYARVRADERRLARERVHLAHAKDGYFTRHWTEDEWAAINRTWELAAAAAGATP